MRYDTQPIADLMGKAIDKLSSYKEPKYSVTWTGHNTYAVVNSKEEIVYFGSLERCERMEAFMNNKIIIAGGHNF